MIKYACMCDGNVVEFNQPGMKVEVPDQTPYDATDHLALSLRDKT